MPSTISGSNIGTPSVRGASDPILAVRSIADAAFTAVQAPLAPAEIIALADRGIAALALAASLAPGTHPAAGAGVAAALDRARSAAQGAPR